MEGVAVQQLLLQLQALGTRRLMAVIAVDRAARLREHPIIIIMESRLVSNISLISD